MNAEDKPPRSRVGSLNFVCLGHVAGIVYQFSHPTVWTFHTHSSLKDTISTLSPLATLAANTAQLTNLSCRDMLPTRVGARHDPYGRDRPVGVVPNACGARHTGYSADPARPSIPLFLWNCAIKFIIHGATTWH